MPAKEYLCKVTQVKWLTPTVIDLRFEPAKKFSFEPGQFISVVVPDPKGGEQTASARLLAGRAAGAGLGPLRQGCAGRPGIQLPGIAQGGRYF